MSAAVPGATGAPRLSVETALQQPMDLAAGAKPRKKRQAAPRREGDAWKSVTVLKEHETSPQLQCNNCSKTFCGGHTRIVNHIIGGPGVEACTTSASTATRRST